MLDNARRVHHVVVKKRSLESLPFDRVLGVLVGDLFVDRARRGLVMVGRESREHALGLDLHQLGGTVLRARDHERLLDESEDKRDVSELEIRYSTTWKDESDSPLGGKRGTSLVRGGNRGCTFSITK